MEIAELKFEMERAHQQWTSICRVCGDPAVVHFARSEFCGVCFWKVSMDLFGRGTGAVAANDRSSRMKETSRPNELRSDERSLAVASEAGAEQ